MTDKKFAIIHNLDGLSTQEIQQYLRAASAYFKLDPDLNALDTIWMNSEDGMRKLVVYARKGTTDILRDIWGIEISTLVQQNGPGYVSFMATGKNKAGRQEIAVGAHSIDGLTGQRLADAIMTAQTRALRRLTLQFVGGGILDVSELSGTTADIAASKSSLAQLAGSPVVLPPPQAAPSAISGRDITPIISETSKIDFPASKNPQNEGVSSKIPMPTVSELALALPASDPLVKAAEASVQTQPKKRTRKKRNTVDLASPGQVAVPIATANEPEGGVNGNDTLLFPLLAAPRQMEMPVGYIDAAGTIIPQPEAPSAPAPALVAAVAKSDSRSLAGAVSAEKNKVYRERLAKYSQDILPKAGMMPSDGIGGVAMKLRKFAVKFTGAENAQALAEREWEELFEYLDGYVDEHGAKALVENIDKVIGAKL